MDVPGRWIDRVMPDRAVRFDQPDRFDGLQFRIKVLDQLLCNMTSVVEMTSDLAGAKAADPSGYKVNC